MSPRCGCLLIAMFATSACGSEPPQARCPASPVCTTPQHAEGEPCAARTSAADSEAPVRVLQPPTLAGFDCARVDAPSDNTCGAWGAFDWAPLPRELRLAQGGGPEGVAWNPSFLECGAYIRRTCEGAASAQFHLGQRLVTSLELPRDADEVGCRFAVDAKTLARGADNPVPRGPFEPVFTSVAFRLELTELCDEPPHVRRAHDYFVSGFATGE